MASVKLKDIKKGTWAVRAVPLHLVNTPPAPGQQPDEVPATIKVGVRVLLGDETAEAYEKAQEYARHKGVQQWSEDHPLCRLYEMACHVFYAVCAVDQETGEPEGTGRVPDGFFESVDQMLSNDRIGTDNIAYLHEQWVRWQDQNRGGTPTMTINEVCAAVMTDMEVSDSRKSPLLSMGHATLVSCVRILGGLLLISQNPKSPSGSGSDGGSPEISKSLLKAGLVTQPAASGE